uniref:TIGR00255 family protein n=1 Tax=Candidatus Kentrum sp. TUN TaxID=2126343 RepID=A0A451A8N8_9GAMM|nr:MAG: TIGR00255 family protein [Candidatus Kentron sp. TUN]VFK71854.1 MAG: TIGR00255 family protein [Candidatus Kentron sp. TUN]
MIYSMTAFARDESQTEGGGITWELRSVNHRYLDVSVRLPEELRFLESIVRERVRNKIQRGKVECLLRYKPVVEKRAELNFNRDLVRQVAKAAQEVGVLFGNVGPINPMAILSWPGIVEPPVLDIQSIRASVLNVLDNVLADLIATRLREGEKLATLIETRCAEMIVIIDRARQRLPVVLAMQRDRFVARLSEIKAELNTDRLEQELVFFAQKIDVAEELDRLDTHLAEIGRLFQEQRSFGQIPHERKPIGRRLDFLMQEMHREANTLSAKSVDMEMTSASVELRVLIEQMREQVQNVE